MIKINLALRKSATLVEAKTGLTNMTVADLRKLDLSAITKFPALKSMVFCLVVGWLGFWVMGGLEEREVARAQAKIDELKEEQQKIRKTLEESKKFEGLKKSLEEDEKVIRNKLEVIEQLVADRSAPSRSLLALSGAMPRDIWLSEVRFEPKEIQFRGDATDFNVISEFIRSLNESVSFKDVVLKSTQQARDEVGSEIAKFDISVRRR